MFFAAGTTQQSRRRPRLPTFYDIAWLKPLLFIASGLQVMQTLRDIIITGIPKFLGTPARAWQTVRSGQTLADCLLIACTCCDRHPWPDCSVNRIFQFGLKLYLAATIVLVVIVILLSQEKWIQQW